MSDLWRRWDAEVAQRGHRDATELLTDAELVSLLASDEEPQRQQEKRLLREEAFRRMQGARGGNPEPMRGQADEPSRASRLPSPGEYEDPF